MSEDSKWSWKGVYSHLTTAKLPHFMSDFAEKAVLTNGLLFREDYNHADIDDNQKPEKYKERNFKDFYRDLLKELVDKFYTCADTPEGMRWSQVQEQRKNRFKTQKETEEAIQPIHEFDKALDAIGLPKILTTGLRNWPSNRGESPTISQIPFPSIDTDNPQLVYGLRDTLYKYELNDAYKVMPFMDSKLEKFDVPELVWSPTLNIAMHSYFLKKSKNDFPLRFILPKNWQSRLVTDNIAENNMETGEGYTEDKFIGMLFVRYHKDREFGPRWKQPPFGKTPGHIPLFIFGPYHTTSVTRYNEPYFSHFKLFNVDGMMVDLGQLFPRKRFTYAEIRDVMYKLSPQRDASEIIQRDFEEKKEELEKSDRQDIFGRLPTEQLKALGEPVKVREIQRLEMYRVNDVGENEEDVHLLIRNRNDNDNDKVPDGLSRVCFDWAEMRGTMEIRDFDFDSTIKDCSFYGSQNAGGGVKKGVAFGLMIASIVASAFVPRGFF